MKKKHPAILNLQPWGDRQCGEKHSGTLPCFRFHPRQVGSRQGLVSNNHEKTTTWKKSSQLWKQCIFFLWDHEKRNERPEHRLPLSRGKSQRLNFWVAFLPTASVLLCPKTSRTSCLSWTSFWQLTTSFELIVLGQPLLSFSSGFGSRLGRVIKYVASSYTTRLETEQVLLSPNRRGGGGIWGEEELETLTETVLVACMI